MYRKFVSLGLFTLCATATAQPDATLQNAAEHCMRSSLLNSIVTEDNAAHASFFFEAATTARVIQVVLGESIATHAWNDSVLYIAVGGTVDPTTLAEGLRLVLRSPPVEGKTSWPSVTMVYFTHSEDTRYLAQITKEGAIKLRIEPLDARSIVGLRESGCAI